MPRLPGAGSAPVKSLIEWRKPPLVWSAPVEADYIAELAAVTDAVAAFVLKHRSADLMSVPALADRTVRDELTTIGREAVASHDLRRRGDRGRRRAGARGGSSSGKKYATDQILTSL